MRSELRYSEAFATFLVFLAGTFAMIALKAGDRGWARTFIGGAMGLTMAIVSGYLKRAKEKREKNRYGEVLGRISEITGHLSEVKQFLELEEGRIAEAKEIVSSLEKEKERLEPIVNSNQAIVEAILAAQAKRNSRFAFRSHLIAFAMGVVSSLLASYLFAFMHKS